MAELSQGTSFSFNGTVYTVTRVSVSLQSSKTARNKISAAHLGSSIDEPEPYVYGFKPRDIDSPCQVEIEFLGSSAPSMGASGAISTTGYGGNGTCISSVVTASVGELLKGTAVFKVPMPD